MDYPILSGMDSKDERSDGVLLLSRCEDGKMTAMDCGDHWYITEWEVILTQGEPTWFDRSGYTICKDMVETLYLHGVNIK